MIERRLIDGRKATVAYLSRKFRPVDASTAEMVKIRFDDGDVRTLVRAMPMTTKSMWQMLIEKSSDHPDLHVRPENAVPIHGIPVADVVTRANVQHVSWEMVREGRTKTVAHSLPLDALIATQEVVDRQRVLKHIGELRATGKTEANQPPLVLLYDDDYFILGGHHGLQAAYDLNIPTVLVDVMEAP